MKKTFTGRHLLMICLAFFGTVIAVNVVMATMATRTFGGTVVDNSYVASQHFNRWLDEADAERNLGWKVAAERQNDGRLSLGLTGLNGPISDARITAVAEHPVGREKDVILNFRAAGAGQFISTDVLPAGRWRLKMDIRTDGKRGRFLEDIPA